MSLGGASSIHRQREDWMSVEIPIPIEDSTKSILIGFALSNNSFSITYFISGICLCDAIYLNFSAASVSHC